MTAAPQRTPDAQLSRAVLAHLDVQIESARRLLGLVLAQGAAIRAQDVEGVVTRLSEIKSEMLGRGGLEEQRAALLVRAGIALGVPAPQVTLEAMTQLMPGTDGERARSQSAELRGLLAEIAREHGINRALMRQELAFLDHLVRLIGQEPQGGYGASGSDSPTAAPLRVVDAKA